MKRVIRVVAGVALLAAGIGAPQGAVAQRRDEPVWKPCGGQRGTGIFGPPAVPGRAANEEECAWVRVPLDYGDPSRTISLALTRIRGTAAPGRDHLGVLLVNPGGPGASGRDLARRVAAQLPPGLSGRFDVVGFDPRGVGRSRPALRCMSPEKLYDAPRPDYVPRDRREEGVLVGRARRYAEACGSRWNWLLPYMTTENSARDMDAIREALGERRISYLGYSYGTYLGAVYATLFPDRVGRMVLDSVVDPKGIWYESNLAQNVTFDRRHQDFLRWTARHNDVYRLGPTQKAVSFAWYAMRDRLRDHPAGGRLGPSELDDLYTVAGYSDLVWPQFARAFSAYVRKGDAGPLLAAHRRNVETDAAAENSYAVYLAVQCRDAPWPRDWGAWRRDMTRMHSRAPFLTWSNAWYNAPCAFWPQRGGTPVRLRDDPRLPPIMLIQAERDAATPYDGALRLRRLFTASRLVSATSGNHGVAFDGNACVDRRLFAYLRDGTLPAPAPAATSARPAASGDARRAGTAGVGTGAAYGAARRPGIAADVRCAGNPEPVPVEDRPVARPIAMGG
ncbi:alpha/beta hydrolase [Streptosporangium sandarakinum]